MIRSILIILVAMTLQQCSYSQNDSSKNKSANMDSTKKNLALTKEGNPVYSKTDTSEVKMSE